AKSGLSHFAYGGATVRGGRFVRYSAGAAGKESTPMADENQNGRKPMIVGGAKERPADEMDEITQMIEEAQHSSRARYIPAEDLDEHATTQMSPHVAEI